MIKIKNIKIYDTTLRDGTQGEGVSLSADEKIKIALELDKLGFDYIEGGWPGSNQKDREFFEKVKSIGFKNAKLAAFSMTKRKNVEIEKDSNMIELLKAETPVITIVGKSWDKHVDIVLKISHEDNLNMIYDTIKFFKDHGREVIFDAEHYFDAFKSNKEYALKTLKIAETAGADYLVLCETNGGTMTDELIEIIEATKQQTNTPLGIHCHNDSGLAIANTIAAVEHGCEMVQGTINGMGERTGNADLIPIISNLQLKKGLKCLEYDRIKELKHLSLFVYDIMNLIPDKKQPYVGESAFAHKGGMHADAVNKDPFTYEHINPEEIGNKRRILASDLSGKSNIYAKAKEFGIELDDNEARNITKLVKEKESQGYSYEAADASLELLMITHKNPDKELFKTEKFLVTTERENGCDINRASIVISVKGEKREAASEGNGPVDALNKALRNALSEFYPTIKKIHLTDFKVRIVDAAKATEAITLVLVESTDGRKTWITIGVSRDIIAASYEALVEGIEYGLLSI